MFPTAEFYKDDFVVGVIPKEGLAGQSFFGYDNDKDLKVCFFVMLVK